MWEQEHAKENKRNKQCPRFYISKIHREYVHTMLTFCNAGSANVVYQVMKQQLTVLPDTEQHNKHQ